MLTKKKKKKVCYYRGGGGGDCTWHVPVVVVAMERKGSNLGGYGGCLHSGGYRLDCLVTHEGRLWVCIDGVLCPLQGPSVVRMST